jgi:diguanylate cyclase (GGDEF)-like protein
MGKLLPWLYVTIALICPAGAGGEVHAVLGHVSEVAALTNAEAAKALPVHLSATVTFVRPTENTLFVIENGVGIYVRFSEDLGLRAGDRVEINGVTRNSFKATIFGQSVHFLSHGDLPVPKPAKFDDLIQSKWDCQYVQITGRVLSASLDDAIPRNLRIHIEVPHGTVEGVLVEPGNLRAEDLLDAEVRMTGVAGGEYDGKMQLAGVMLNMNSWRDLAILHRARANPWTIPIVPMDSVVAAYRYSNQSRRVHIAGTLTYYEPGSLAVLDAHGRSILVRTNSLSPFRAGQSVEATGYPYLVGESMGLDFGQLRSGQSQSPAIVQTVGWESASVGGHTYDLVAMEGEVVGMLHDARVDLFLIQSDGHLFSATLRHRSSNAADPLDHAARPSIGSRVRITGVCFVDAGSHWRDRLWFDLRMRSLNDVVVLRPPSWWTVKRMAYILTALSAVILVAVAWVGMLDRRLRKQSAILARQSQEDAIRERQLARLEQQRSEILEAFSSPAPLPEVLRKIQAMVSSRLFGCSCWFELHAVADGGERVHPPAGPGIVFQELLSPDGTSLGFLLATPLHHGAMGDDIASAVTVGARLAELAIDTRRLYSDLRHRSEYDLLTDIPNRFSMEKKLDELMLRAAREEGIFGLIYVDLDRFKQVNDRYGHRIGDLYLQEATRRMKTQLRNGDVLARVGGDEFIALIPILRSRADAEEIAVRLERCFDEPFEVDGHSLSGAASIGLAVYAEDGATKEDMQRSADAAMYAHKQEKQQQKLAREMRQFETNRASR